MALARPQRRIAAFLTLAAWLLALACTSVYACELALPAPTHDCCPEQAVDAACGAHCELDQQAPATVWPDLTQSALAMPVLRVAVAAPVLRAQPPPEVRGTPPPLTILFVRLRN